MHAATVCRAAAASAQPRPGAEACTASGPGSGVARARSCTSPLTSCAAPVHGTPLAAVSLAVQAQHLVSGRLPTAGLAGQPPWRGATLTLRRDSADAATARAPTMRGAHGRRPARVGERRALTCCVPSAFAIPEFKCRGLAKSRVEQPSEAAHVWGGAAKAMHWWQRQSWHAGLHALT